MANHEPEVIIDLTDSFTLVDHASLANTVIELDDSVVVVSDSSQVVSPTESRVNRSNRTRRRNTSSISRRTRSSIQTTSNVTAETSNSQENQLAGPKHPKKKLQTHAVSKEIEDTSRNCSPIRIGCCPICFEGLGKNPLASTKCGHVFCTACLEQSLRLGRKCPTCRRALRGSTAYHRLFLCGD